jgi:hypothetical protein
MGPERLAKLALGFFCCLPMAAAAPQSADGAKVLAHEKRWTEACRERDISLLSELRVHRHGNVAVVTGADHESGSAKGKHCDDRDRPTGVWMKMEGTGGSSPRTLDCSALIGAVCEDVCRRCRGDLRAASALGKRARHSVQCW